MHSKADEGYVNFAMFKNGTSKSLSNRARHDFRVYGGKSIISHETY
ncbi:MAG: hypothetical protein ACP5LB_07485 [Candidatus Bathyarchaeia archaeon]